MRAGLHRIRRAGRFAHVHSLRFDCTGDDIAPYPILLLRGLNCSLIDHIHYPAKSLHAKRDLSPRAGRQRTDVPAKRGHISHVVARVIPRAGGDHILNRDARGALGAGIGVGQSIGQ